ncbi:MAG TPA: hypothetical protein VJI96_00855 [Candidatus Andersenbacteria bacterium]|nr:hypothetical protein [Candidatus Andersenbacteria bacterium]
MNTQIGPLLKSITTLFPSSHYALLSLFLFIGLELLFVIHRWLFLLFFIFLAILIIGIFLIRSEEGEQFHPTQTILPGLAAFGFGALAIYLPLTSFLHIYFLVCAILFFFILKHGAKQAYPTWNMVISPAVLFTVIAPAIGWRFTLYTPVWVMLAILFPIIVLIAFQSLLRYTKTLGEAGMIALSLGFVLTEITWILQFLPLHFIVQAGLIVAIYHTIVQLSILTIEKNLTKRTILEYSLAGAGALLILGITAHWS